jgi:putative restriction endonuclease
MVEAAHIGLFAVSGDDDPRNGLGLTPDMHWATDRNLIAPGPDLRWQFSPVLDERVPDLQRLVGLRGRKRGLKAALPVRPAVSTIRGSVPRL